MWIKTSLAIWATVTSTPGENAKFDLVCLESYTAPAVSAATVRYSVDLDKMLYCKQPPRGSSFVCEGAKISSVDQESIVFTSFENGQFHIHLSVNRYTGEIFSDSNVPFVLPFSGGCMKASFTPIPPAKF